MKKIDLAAIGAVVFIVIALAGLAGIEEISWAINLIAIIGAVSFLFCYTLARIGAKIIPKRMPLGG